MVIVPAGNFTMGDKSSSRTSPTRKIRIAQPFAVSRYEITYADFDKFTQNTNRNKISDNGWGRGSRPVTNISWQDAKDYAAWLRRKTSRKYRLLTEAEWEYIARAKSKKRFWWTGSASGYANCRKGCDSSYSGFFNAKSAPVGSYSANPFKVFDTSGNVAEWTEDCYQDHYLNAPRDGSAVQQKNCTQRVIRGGSFRSNSKDIASYSRDGAPTNTRKEDIGLRVAVDLY